MLFIDVFIGSYYSEKNGFGGSYFRITDNFYGACCYVTYFLEAKFYEVF
jgi:hypothetical protein